MADLTYTLQELEAFCADASPGRWVLDAEDCTLKSPVDGHTVAKLEECKQHAGRSLADASFISAARTAIPELIAVIRELDPSFHAKPSENSVARATELMRDAADRRSKLEDALAKAKLGNTDELRALELEAYFEEDGTVKIRQKRREATEHGGPG